MDKPTHYFDVFVIFEDVYRYGCFDSNRKVYYETLSKAETAYYDKIASYCSDGFKIEKTGLLYCTAKDSIDKWEYKIGLEKDVIKIW